MVVSPAHILQNLMSIIIPLLRQRYFLFCFYYFNVLKITVLVLSMRIFLSDMHKLTMNDQTPVTSSFFFVYYISVQMLEKSFRDTVSMSAYSYRCYYSGDTSRQDLRSLQSLRQPERIIPTNSGVGREQLPRDYHREFLITLFTPWNYQFPAHLQVELENVTLPLDKISKILGVRLDPSFTFTPHIKEVALKCRNRQNKLKVLRGGSRTLRTLLAYRP